MHHARLIRGQRPETKAAGVVTPRPPKNMTTAAGCQAPGPVVSTALRGRLAAAWKLLADLAGRGIEPSCPWLPLRFHLERVAGLV